MQKQDSKKLGSMRLSEFRNHLLCYEYMEVVVIPAKLTHDDFCKKVYEKYGDKFSIMSEYINSKSLVQIRHNECGAIFSVRAIKLSYKDGNIQCPCEYGKRFDKDINSVYVVDKDFAKLFANPDDTLKHTIHSSSKVDFKCPNCGHIVESKRIRDVYRHGLTCRHCSDNIPFAERIMYSLLDIQRHLLDDNQFVFDKTFDWSHRKEYDFYFCINGVPYIVEMNGEQHYIERKNSKICSNLSYQQENDRLKKNLAIKNGILDINYIQIDCRKSDYMFIKKNIINSKLFEVLKLCDFDWNYCFQQSTTSLLVKLSELWNIGVRDVETLKMKTGLSNTAIYKFLCRGRDIGLCDYTNIVKTKVRCINDDIIFDSITDAGKYYNIKSNNISAVCRKTRNYCGVHPTTKEPLMWKYA